MNAPELDDLKEKALETAYRLLAYSMYGGKFGGAVRALKRRCPGHDPDAVAACLRDALEVQRNVHDWLEENSALAFEEYKKTDDAVDFRRIAAPVYATHSSWPQAGLDALFGMNFLYFHLM